MKAAARRAMFGDLQGSGKLWPKTASGKRKKGRSGGQHSLFGVTVTKKKRRK